ncbi:AtpZ/AtpI family protein [Candidatus Gottesmanbacteria bacterium]|nr:AtpZ/AtpI family protein [Candidatus Gottesmanbacteria bacterium]
MRGKPKDRYTLSLKEDTGDISVAKRREDALKKRGETWYYIGFVGEIGFAIAIPIAGGAILGTYADKVFLTYPTLTLSFLFLGFVVSIIGFIRTIQEIIRH